MVAKLARIIIVVTALAAVCHATNHCDIGLDFRLTSGYVTDPSYGVPNLGEGTQQTKTSSGGCPITYQWMTTPSGTRDRSTSDDVRLAGINYMSAPVNSELRITNQAAGQYNIGVAMGDAGNPQGGSGCTLTIKFNDGTGGSTLLTVTFTGTISSNNFVDASGVSRTAANWPSANMLESITTTGTTLSVVFSTSGSCAGVTMPITHIRLTPVGSAKTCTLSTMGAGPC